MRYVLSVLILLFSISFLVVSCDDDTKTEDKLEACSPSNLTGTCEEGKICKDGTCISNDCSPECTNKTCGNDGCGGTCGNCNTDETCSDAGVCVAPSQDGKLGHKCSVEIECIDATNLCLASNEGDNFGICHQSCNGETDTSCTQTDYTCQAIPTGEFFCFPKEELGTVETGGLCDEENTCLRGWCLSAGGLSYCFDDCTTASDSSNECGGSECVDFGEGFYCEPVPSREVGERCTIAETCVDNGWCLTSNESNFYCFASCTTASDSSAECNGDACVEFGTAPNNSFYCTSEN